MHVNIEPSVNHNTINFDVVVGGVRYFLASLVNIYPPSLFLDI